MTALSPSFDLSVVIPLDDDHGYGEACVGSWNAQTHPRARVQLVIVDPGNQASLMRRIKPLLAPHDLVLEVKSENEGLLYARGASSAHADLVFMTEGHCVAEPHAAAEILSVFQNPAVAAVSGASTHLHPTLIAQQQTLLEKEWLGAWPPGHWQTISLRAFAIRRSVYEQLGGLRPEYRRFCANALVIELERRGLRLAPTRSPIVRHGNSMTISDVIDTLRDCGRGQIVWRRDFRQHGNAALADRYLGGLDLWSRRGDLARTTARALAWPLLLSMARDWRGLGGLHQARLQSRSLLRLFVGLLLGQRASLWGQRARLAWAAVRCAAACIHQRGLLPSYHQLWCRSFDCGFGDYAAREPVEKHWFAPGTEPAAIALLDEGAVAGLYAAETWGPGGPMIRWSGPVFMLRLSLSRGQSHRLLFDIRSNLPRGRRSLRAFCNGQELPESHVEDTQDQVRIFLPTQWLRVDGRQELVVTCRVVRPSDNGVVDPRCLGLALFAVQLLKAQAEVSPSPRAGLSPNSRTVPLPDAPVFASRPAA